MSALMIERLFPPSSEALADTGFFVVLELEHLVDAAKRSGDRETQDWCEYKSFPLQKKRIPKVLMKEIATGSDACPSGVSFRMITDLSVCGDVSVHKQNDTPQLFQARLLHVFVTIVLRGQIQGNLVGDHGETQPCFRTKVECKILQCSLQYPR